MTAKRFTIEIDDENIAHILDNGTDIGQYNLCKLLNELHEENQHKQKLLHSTANQIQNLLEENQQLKKEIENLKQGMIHAAFTKEWK